MSLSMAVVCFLSLSRDTLGTEHGISWIIDGDFVQVTAATLRFCSALSISLCLFLHSELRGHACNACLPIRHTRSEDGERKKTVIILRVKQYFSFVSHSFGFIVAHFGIEQRNDGHRRMSACTCNNLFYALSKARYRDFIRAKMK